MSDPFIDITILAFPKPYQDAEGKVITPDPNAVTLGIRPAFIIGTNDLVEGPHPDAKSIIYFHAYSGMRQEFSTETADAIRQRVAEAEAD